MNVAERIAASRAEAGEPAACLNCGAALTGRYCSACGQKARVQKSLRGFFADFAAGLVNFDNKFWRTLPMLAWCPGDLTRRYVEGERVRFISPIGLYLFTVFLMFAVLGLTGALGELRIDGSLENTIKAEQLKLGRMERQRSMAADKGGSTAPFDKQIAEVRADLEALDKLKAGQAPIVMDEGDSAPKWLRDAAARAAADPRGTMTKVQQAASSYSWLLIPLSVPVLRLLFPLRRRRLYDHTVFVTYSLSFAMLLVIAGGLLTLIGAGGLVWWLALLPPWHMYRQLKGAYSLSRGAALFRTALLLFASTMILMLWMVIIVAVGALS